MEGVGWKDSIKWGEERVFFNGCVRHYCSANPAGPAICRGLHEKIAEIQSNKLLQTHTHMHAHANLNMHEEKGKEANNEVGGGKILLQKQWKSRVAECLPPSANIFFFFWSAGGIW